MGYVGQGAKEEVGAPTAHSRRKEEAEEGT